MLKSLHIQDYAIVDNLTVEFFSGLNVLTGETGAGKSILVGALSLLLGERAQTEMVRTGKDVAIVEGLFAVPSSPDWADFLRAQGWTDEVASAGGNVRVRREVQRRGASRCLVNGRSVTLAQLKAFGDRIGDLCGQHHHQSLLDPVAHVRFLDEQTGLQDEASAFRAAFDQLKADQKRWEDIITRAEERRQAYELARFQAEEIRAAGLTPTEEDDLKRELNVLKNARRLVEAAQRAAAVLSEDPESAADRIAAVRKELGSLIEIDARLAPTVELLEKCDTLLREAVFTIGDYSRGLGFDPQRAEQIETRLVEIFKLKQKYGSSCAEILRRGEELEHRLAQYRNEDEHTDELAARIADQKKKLVDRAQALSRRRRRAARKLEEQVNVTLAEVGMKGATWRVRFDPVEFGPIQAPIGDRETPLSENGIEDVEFEIETNPGEGFKPLVRIASGGELSRVMLALKAVGKPARDVSFLVFDEVDSGIGGKVAYAVAGQLKALAQHYQVFLISHLQQMASPADHHFTVVKKKSGNRVTTRIELLDRQGRVEEIARMMATETITDATRRHAEEIIRPPAKR